jgi:hypothetical protein
MGKIRHYPDQRVTPILEVTLVENTRRSNGRGRRITRSYRASICKVCNVALGNVFAVKLLKLFFGKFAEIHPNDILQTPGSLSLPYSSERAVVTTQSTQSSPTLSTAAARSSVHIVFDSTGSLRTSSNSVRAVCSNARAFFEVFGAGKMTTWRTT